VPGGRALFRSPQFQPSLINQMHSIKFLQHRYPAVIGSKNAVQRLARKEAPAGGQA